jgi:hypothetical protein
MMPAGQRQDTARLEVVGTSAVCNSLYSAAKPG